MSLRLAILVPFVISLVRGCQTTPPKELASAAALRDSVGVNLHLEYDDTPYADPRRTLAALRLLGVDHVRDAAMRSGPEREGRFTALAQAGVKFDLFVNRNLPGQLAAISRLMKAQPGAVDLIEGPNEANHEPFGSFPGGDAPAAQAYQVNLFAQTRRTGDLARVPVANFTYWPPLAGRADWVNYHAYPQQLQPVAPQLAWMRHMASALQPPRSPVVCTETGFPTAGQDASSQTRQAALTLVVLLESFRAHVKRTYLYELFDEHPDAGGRADRENHFGFFRNDGSPKPAALALSRLMRLLNAPDAPSKASAAPALALHGPSLRTLALPRSDGSRLTLVWWADAQSVASRSLRIEAPAGAQVHAISLVEGREQVLAPGENVLTTHAGPIALLQAERPGAPPR